MTALFAVSASHTQVKLTCLGRPASLATSWWHIPPSGAVVVALPYWVAVKACCLGFVDRGAPGVYMMQVVVHRMFAGLMQIPLAILGGCFMLHHAPALLLVLHQTLFENGQPHSRACLQIAG